MHDFYFHHHDSGDRDNCESVWVAAYVDDTDHVIGAYVCKDGAVILDDHDSWNIRNDLENMGLDPDSLEANALVDEWIGAARKYGLILLAECE